MNIETRDETVEFFPHRVLIIEVPIVLSVRNCVIVVKRFLVYENRAARPSNCFVIKVWIQRFVF